MKNVYLHWRWIKKIIKKNRIKPIGRFHKYLICIIIFPFEPIKFDIFTRTTTTTTIMDEGKISNIGKTFFFIVISIFIDKRLKKNKK